MVSKMPTSITSATKVLCDKFAQSGLNNSDDVLAVLASVASAAYKKSFKEELEEILDHMYHLAIPTDDCDYRRVNNNLRFFWGPRSSRSIIGRAHKESIKLFEKEVKRSKLSFDAKRFVSYERHNITKEVNTRLRLLPKTAQFKSAANDTFKEVIRRVYLKAKKQGKIDVVHQILEALKERNKVGWPVYKQSQYLADQHARAMKIFESWLTKRLHRNNQ